MPIRNIPFLEMGGIYRPFLPVSIINPHTDKSVSLLALVDTGADDCVMPADLARRLGHDFKKGTPVNAGTARGKNKGYCHTTKIEIFDLSENPKLLHTISDTPIAFMPGLRVPLLGVKKFLDTFDVHIYYPQRYFSIKYPTSHSSP